MTRNPFSFVDDDFLADENPTEVPLTADNPRIPLFPPKATVSDDSQTKAGQKLAERIAEAHNIGLAANLQVTADDIPEAVIRAFEAVDASPNANVPNLSMGSLQTLSTGEGDLFYVEVLLSPLGLMPDPTNGRTILASRSARRKHVSSKEPQKPFLFPTYEVDSANDLVQLVSETQNELGFRGPTVRPGKDYQDILSIGLQGVHEPMTATFATYKSANGEETTLIKVDDGNRRLAAVQRALLEASGGRQFDAVSCWSDPLRNHDGTYSLRPHNADSVNRVRTRQLFNDYRGGNFYPASSKEDDIDTFLRRAERSVRIRTLRRCATVRVRLILGVNRSTLSSSLSKTVSPTAVLTSQIVRRLHIEDAAQKPWTIEAQSIQIALDALSGSHASIVNGADFVPLTETEIEGVLANDEVAWEGCPDGPTHPVRLASKVLATLTCDDHDATQEIKQSLKRFNMSVHYRALADNKARIAAETVMPLLQQTKPDSGVYKQIRAVVDRFSRSPLLIDVTNHPTKETPWWTYCNEETKVLIDLAKHELIANQSLSDTDFLQLDKGSCGAHGPATRALLHLALICAAANPAFERTENKRGRLEASPYQITINGLGGTRGLTKTTPEQVLVQLCKTSLGLEQLGEIVDAGISVRIPTNLFDPHSELIQSDGTALQDSHGKLTEEFLRGPQFGWTESDRDIPDGEAAVADVTKLDQYRLMVTDMIASVNRAHVTALQLLDPESFGEQLTEYGIAETGIHSQLSTLMMVFATGAARASTQR
jgi:hypothetical protein